MALRLAYTANGLIQVNYRLFIPILDGPFLKMVMGQLMLEIITAFDYTSFNLVEELISLTFANGADKR